ncbi:MAG: DUF2284 domain-containing protein [Clostridia bacterium]|nr:DUF2284 domain-containing protein [Clostridia bacterium]
MVEYFSKTISTKEYIESFVNYEQTLEWCKACPNYGRIWTCPPFDFDPMDIWEAYDELELHAIKFDYIDQRDVISKKDELGKKISQLEAETTNSRAIFASCCTECGAKSFTKDGLPQVACQRQNGKKCIKPEDIRYSLEAMGADVGRTLSRLMGIELEWLSEGKEPSYYVLVGGLLKKR